MIYPLGIPNIYRFSIITPMEFCLFLKDFCPYGIPPLFKLYPLGMEMDHLNRGCIFFLEKPILYWPFFYICKGVLQLKGSELLLKLYTQILHDLSSSSTRMPRGMCQKQMTSSNPLHQCTAILKWMRFSVLTLNTMI